MGGHPGVSLAPAQAKQRSPKRGSPESLSYVETVSRGCIQKQLLDHHPGKGVPK